MDPLTTLLNWLAPVLDPLADFRKQVEKLTAIHQSSVHTFSALAGSLIDVPTGPNAFTGNLASSFWEDAQAYLNAENALMGGGTTVGLAGESGVEEAAVACEECVAEITADAGVAATEMAGDVVLDEVTGIVDVAAVAEGGANPIADVAGIILTLVAGAVLLVGLTKLAWDIYNSIQQWQRSMYRAGDTPLPQLPPNPQPVATPTPSSGPSNSLSPAQQRLFNEVKSRLGTTSYNDAEIEALIRAGYLDPDAIAAIIKTTTLSKSENMTTISDNRRHTYTGHTLSSHIAIDRSVLIEQTSKSNSNGGVSRATSFSDPETAQNGVNMVIAKSTKLQAFIKAAAPNTNVQDTQCGDVNDNFGYGYQRNPLGGRGGGYGPSILHNPLHCVTVWVGIDASGKPFIIDAYPSISF